MKCGFDCETGSYSELSEASPGSPQGIKRGASSDHHTRTRGENFYFISNTGTANLKDDKVIDPEKLEPIHIAVVALKYPCGSSPTSSFLRPPSRGSRAVLRPTPLRSVPFGTAIAVRLIRFAAVTGVLTRNARRSWGRHASRAVPVPTTRPGRHSSAARPPIYR
jgi:hypothetical protein